ncbi:Uncharacterised protein [Mycobacteroides abscessus subsp. abscessus]|nr:Uncharacterised protein [Mycobacteroides abscessus subsp. abscessus]
MRAGAGAPHDLGVPPVLDEALVAAAVRGGGLGHHGGAEARGPAEVPPGHPDRPVRTVGGRGLGLHLGRRDGDRTAGHGGGRIRGGAAVGIAVEVHGAQQPPRLAGALQGAVRVGQGDADDLGLGAGDRGVVGGGGLPPRQQLVDVALIGQGDDLVDVGPAPGPGIRHELVGVVEALVAHLGIRVGLFDVREGLGVPDRFQAEGAAVGVDGVQQLLLVRGALGGGDLHDVGLRGLGDRRVGELPGGEGPGRQRGGQGRGGQRAGPERAAAPVGPGTATGAVLGDVPTGAGGCGGAVHSKAPG